VTLRRFDGSEERVVALAEGLVTLRRCDGSEERVAALQRLLGHYNASTAQRSVSMRLQRLL
jgi:hypothetical protein